MENQKSCTSIQAIVFLLLCMLLVTFPMGCSWNNDSMPGQTVMPSGKVTLSWDEVQAATAYNVYFSTKPGVTKHNSFKIQNAANPITIVDLEFGTTYYFIVTVVDNFGEGQESEEISYQAADPEGFIKFQNLLALQDLIIYFDTNSTKLSKTEIEKLNRFAQYISGLASYQVKLDGYTDSTGVIARNKLVSKNRAAIVKSYLVSRGVQAEHIDIMGHGATSFIAGNNNPEGRRLNRRVEIKYYTIK